MYLRPRIFIGLLGIVLCVQANSAFAACETVSAADVSNALKNSPYANDTLKGASCDFGGAAIAESGGNTCSHNARNFGVLQLNKGNLPPGMTGQQYMDLPMQQQVDIWAQRVGNSNTRGGFQTLTDNDTIGGTEVTAGMKAACFQFGPAICRNDISYMQANGGQCPTAGSGGVNINDVPGAQSTANLDGNNQSICSWGGAIQNQINKAAATCKGGNQNCLVGDFPDTGTQTTQVAAAAAPLPTAADINTTVV